MCETANLKKKKITCTHVRMRWIAKPRLAKMADSTGKRFCEEYLSKSVHYRHRRLYYNKSTQQWGSSRVFYKDETAETRGTRSSNTPPLERPDNETGFVDTSDTQSIVFSDDDSICMEEPVHEGRPM